MLPMATHDLTTLKSPRYAKSPLSMEETHRRAAPFPDRPSSRCIGQLTRAASAGEVLLPLVLAFLNPAELCVVSCTCTSWRRAADDSFLWERLLDKLWDGKVYVPEEFRKHRSNGELKQAYFGSLNDSKREYLTPEELTSFDWDFRFKEAAGPGWTDQDPWYRNCRAVRVKFHSDGTLHRSVDSSTQSPATLQWRFVRSVVGMSQYRNRPRGSLIRASVSGLDVPTYIASRSPTNNWGFVLESCWAIYTSFPMPARGQCAALEDGNTLSVEDQWEEAMRFNMGIPNSFGEFDEGEEEGSVESQRREGGVNTAVLVLPDGHTIQVPLEFIEPMLARLVRGGIDVEEVDGVWQGIINDDEDTDNDDEDEEQDEDVVIDVGEAFPDEQP